MPKNRIKKLFNYGLLSVLLTFSIIPGFNLIGNLFLQVVVTIVCALIILLVSDFLLKADAVSVSNSLTAMVVFWVFFALFKQIEIHIVNNDRSLCWILNFYYDKPALIFVVIIVCVLYYIFKLMINKKDAFVCDYKLFIRKTSILFLTYYSIILVYSFFLIREITFIPPVFNIKPFAMIEFTFTRGYIDYELIFLFLGNIAIFLPLGIFAPAFTKNKIFIVFLPIILSSGIEISQYFLGNGHPDIDDFILNVIGFYIGVGIKILLDYLVHKFSKGKFTSFFILD